MTADRMQIRTQRHGQAPGHDRRPASARQPAFRPGDANLRKADNAWFGAAHAGPGEIGSTTHNESEIARSAMHTASLYVFGPAARSRRVLGPFARTRQLVNS
jgi:hypothetical protein